MDGRKEGLQSVLPDGLTSKKEPRRVRSAARVDRAQLRGRARGWSRLVEQIGTTISPRGGSDGLTDVADRPAESAKAIARPCVASDVDRQHCVVGLLLGAACSSKPGPRREH